MESHFWKSQVAGRGARLDRDSTRSEKRTRRGKNSKRGRLEAAGCSVPPSGLRHHEALAKQSDSNSSNKTTFRSLNIFGAHCRAPTPERAPLRDLEEDTAEQLQKEIEEISSQREKLEQEVEKLKASWRRRLKVIKKKLMENFEKVLKEEIFVDPRGLRPADVPCVPFQGPVPRYAARAATASESAPTKSARWAPMMPSRHSESAVSSTTAMEEAVAYHVTTVTSPRGANVAAASKVSTVEAKRSGVVPEPGSTTVTTEMTPNPSSRRVEWAEWRRSRLAHPPAAAAATTAVPSTAALQDHKHETARKLVIARPPVALVEAACRKARQQRKERMRVKVSIPIRGAGSDKENAPPQPVRSPSPDRSGGWWY